MRGNNVHDETHIMLLEGPPTPLAGPDRPEIMDSICEQYGQKGSKQTSRTNLAVRQQSLQHLCQLPYPHQDLQYPEIKNCESGACLF